MAENQDNQLPPAIPSDLSNQNPAPRTMYDYAKPNLTGTESSIVRPAIAANNLELKPNTIQMIHQFFQFDGWQDENLNTHMANFLEICDTFKINGVSDEAIRLRLFPFSLRNKAKQWLNSLRRGCPHHGLPLWLQVQTFYNGVNPSTRQMIDAVVVGTINNKTPEEVELLNKKIDGLLGSTLVHPVMQCEASGGGSSNPEYQPYGHNMENEQLNYMGNQRLQNPPGFQQPLYQHEKKPNLEEMLSKFIAVSKTHFQNTETTLKNQQASIQGLETQIGQLSKLISERPLESLPSNTKPNPKEHVKVVTLRSGKVLAESEKKLTQEAVISEKEEEKPENSDKPVPKEYKPPVLYQAKLKKDRMDAQFRAFNKKKKFEDLSIVELNEECSAILQNKLPTKLKDPGSFTIPCLIGSLNVEKALADLGASINLMPYKMFKQLGLGEPKPTRMSIQLADRSVKYPRGIIEDVLVKVDKFIFPVNFIVLDMDEGVEVPLILGHLFLATARAVIDVGDGKLVLKVGDEEIIFKIYDAMRFSREQDDSCYFIDSINHATQDSFQEIILKDTKELYLAQGEEADDDSNEHSSRQAEYEGIKINDELK
ncbi:hypothetical protein CXB51_013684 [Gossypium anomalum]|uniref:Retrotransposon gag domain-containing protein n=1 Tax=Gossypium anomalum TaxID=47600 RepID=A0A8J5YQA9_9ROSI|nr:hypothetical protein CXB51_013684 [Gossypium anomalum]